MEKQIYENIDELRNLINVLSSNEEKLRFLESIRKNNDIVVLNLILEIKGDANSDILENGLSIALQNNNNKLIHIYGEKIVDYYFKNGFVIILPKKLLNWGNDELISYALGKLPISQDENDLLETVHFYKKMGIENDFLKQTEAKLLEIQLLDTEYPHKACNQLIKLGRYPEAIEHYLKSNKPSSLSRAWEIAKDYVPEMKGRIAKRVCKIGLVKNASELTYVESSQELKCEKKAIKELRKCVSNLKPNLGRYFYTLVEALLVLNLPDEINKVLNVARKYANSTTDCSSWDAYKEMIGLCDIAGEKAESKRWMIKRLEYEIANTHNSNAPNTLAEYEKKTSDKSLRIMLLPLFEKTQMYGEAEKLAIELNMPEKAETYSKLAALFVASHIN